MLHGDLNGKKVPQRGDTYIHMGFPGGSDSKESAYTVGDLCLIPGSERFPKEGNDNPLQCLFVFSLIHLLILIGD